MNDMKKFYEVEGVPDSSGYFPSQSSQKEVVWLENNSKFLQRNYYVRIVGNL